MPTPTAKTSTPAKDKDRRKSGGKPTLISTLKVSPGRLRKIIAPSEVKEESPLKESPAPSVSAPPSDAPAPPTAVNGDNASESNPGTPAQALMGPPTDGPKKKGVKRSAPGANGNEPKIRGKPGPKKKPRLEDGSIDPSSRAGGAYHKLGPKANQGAINAGLRALDRSGKPCRRWAKGGFRLKSFTGVLWEVPRWTAPPKSLPEIVNPESTASGESSNKENNKEGGSQLKSEHSNSAADGEQQSVPPSVVAASSPAPMSLTAAS
ncbi:uncharacterized protein PG986_012064 [Apiospora aurea]|uniref:DUF1711 domain-containing protein n=1 Tax=Apiospora aurea TaxID=335848 RepID=A0ABR1Q036_9PEZI